MLICRRAVRLNWKPSAMEARYLDDDAALVVAESDVVGPFLASYCPYTLQAIVKGALQPVGVGMPYTDGALNRQLHHSRTVRPSVNRACMKIGCGKAGNNIHASLMTPRTVQQDHCNDPIRGWWQIRAKGHRKHFTIKSKITPIGIKLETASSPRPPPPSNLCTTIIKISIITISSIHNIKSHLYSQLPHPSATTSTANYRQQSIVYRHLNDPYLLNRMSTPSFLAGTIRQRTVSHRPRSQWGLWATPGGRKRR